MADETIPPTEEERKARARERHNLRARERRLLNPEKAKARDREKARKLRSRRRDEINAKKNARYRELHPFKPRPPRGPPKKRTERPGRSKIRRAKDPERARSIDNARYRNDQMHKLRRLLRSRMWARLKGKLKAGSAISDLGCSLDEFRIHIERQFLPGMSWGNWNKTGWHLDHIRPLSSFDLADREQLKVAMHFTNYRPLWARDNLEKHSKRTLLL